MKELFTDFVGSTLYAEAPGVPIDACAEGSGGDEGGGDIIEAKEEKECPDVLTVTIGTMVKVTNMGHDEDAAAGPGNRKWLLGEVVDSCEEGDKEWMQVHFWRSYGKEGDPGRIYFPVWASPDGSREVYMMNPRAAGGIRRAERWCHWYEPRELATLGMAMCETKGKGLRVKEWRMDYKFKKVHKCV